MVGLDRKQIARALISADIRSVTAENWNQLWDNCMRAYSLPVSLDRSAVIFGADFYFYAATCGTANYNCLKDFEFF